jgi:hypothetical protein
MRGGQRRTGASRSLNLLPVGSQGSPFLGLSVSPDGKSILYSRSVNDDTDLMLIENFK